MEVFRNARFSFKYDSAVFQTYQRKRYDEGVDLADVWIARAAEETCRNSARMQQFKSKALLLGLE